MTTNIGKTDRIVRVVLGVTLLGTGVVLAGTAGMVLGGVGAVAVLTGAIGHCPAYCLFKKDTCNINPV
ncbi:MAG: DUF2892 domain-containing protein [Nitrospinaceae bacterium]|jgi:hypothetical protein|nr:DUF2892 domain-containing protein [Nitrospinaceae bacterium]